jgi:hypothetical protein
VSLNRRTKLYCVSAISIVAALTWTLAVCLADQSQAEKQNSERPDGNSKCYVCHAGLKTEEITTVHVEMDVTCDECHGPSVEHMHDEMLMTEPDLLFGRSEVNKMCSNRMCHAPGGERQVYGRQDHKDHAAVDAFYKKWLGKTRPNGRAITHDSVCTDCHGTHNLDKATDQLSEQDEQWIAAFNGRDLTGWSASRGSGGATWTVKGGRIVASAGPNAEAGDLWTEALYEDYLLAVTFRADWPIHAGIWLRATDTRRERGPRIEIFESKEPFAFTGSVSVPGKGLALANLREDLIDRESWNTLSVKVQGNKIQVWLNGEEVGAVRLPGPTKGRIGLHIEGQSASRPSELHVREVLVQRLSKTE